MCDEHLEVLIIEADGKTIYGTLHVPDDGAAAHPLVIMSHGFGGAHFPEDPLASDLARAGYLTYAFDFCGGGIASKSSGSMLEMSVLTEADDLNDIMDALLKREDIDRERICLLGRSQGGFVAAYVAARRAADVRALVMFFPAFVIQDDARRRANEAGEFPETSDIAGRIVGRIYNEDAVSFNIFELLGDFHGKVLIIHGDADEIVPLSYSERALTCYDDARLEVLHGAGHGFRDEFYGRESARITLDFLEGALS